MSTSTGAHETNPETGAEFGSADLVSEVAKIRSGQVVRDYVEHIDLMCADAGLTHWTGQINASGGRRVRVLEEYGFSLASATPNRTLSWLARSEVQRITVVREAGSLQRLRSAS